MEKGQTSAVLRRQFRAHVFADLLQVLKRSSDATVPGNIYMELVRQLYARRLAVVATSVVGVGVLGGLAALRARDPWMFGLTAFICLAIASLAPLIIAYRRLPRPPGVIAMLVWERRFAHASYALAAGVGLLCVRALWTSDDALVHLLTLALMLSTVSLVLRNYIRPRILLWQMVVLIGPPAVLLIARGDPFYAALAFGSVTLAYNVMEVGLGFYDDALRLLVNKAELSAQNARFDAALNNMAHGLCMFDSDERLVVCNQRYLDIFGFSRDIVRPGITLRALLSYSAAIGNHPGRDSEEAYDTFTTLLADGTSGVSHYDIGHGRTVSLTYESIPSGGWVAIFEDITERLAADARIAHMARHDPLTALPNRMLFNETLEAALAGEEADEQVAVLCLDLDRFKPVNDTLGHGTGDGVLKQVAERLLSCVDDNTTVARVGGDEFAIVQRCHAQPGGAGALAQRMIDRLNEPFLIDKHQIVIGASVGIAIAPDDASGAEALLKDADLALYRAKADGSGCHRFFTPVLDERMQARCAFELDLRDALGNGEFELAFQPLVTLGTGAIAGFETLLRWRHPVRGVVMPDDFIPMAEEIGIITQIGEWTLRQACAEAAHWPDSVRIAVNLSPVQFQGGNLIGSVVGALAASGLPASRLELEITEGVLLKDTEETLATLRGLRSLGVRIAMDDFGTGYSTLDYLHSFAFDRIKIDQSFVRDLCSSAASLAIVQAVTGLGRSLGMATTAEGVETDEQFERLRAEGCNEVQGTLLGLPTTAAKARKLLAAETIPCAIAS